MKIQIYNHPDLYDACTSHKVDDIPFYEHWAQVTGGTVLELACGTGRLARPLLKTGFDYTGLDLSPVFIRHCKAVYPNGQFFNGDMRNFCLDKKFDLIFLDPPFGVYDLKKLLDHIEQTQSLKPEGMVYYESKQPLEKSIIYESWDNYRESKAGNVYYGLLTKKTLNKI